MYNNPVNFVDPTGHFGMGISKLLGGDEGGGGGGGGIFGPIIYWAASNSTDIVEAGIDCYDAATSPSPQGSAVCAAELANIAAHGPQSVNDGPTSKYYRGIQGPEPTPDDFMSNSALGNPPRGAELKHPELHEGISVFDTLETATERLQVVKKVTHIAEVDPQGVGTLEKTLGPGHYTWWVDPQAAVQTVINVYPLRER